MGRLHDPGPGEILDRLTILSLKIVHGCQRGVVTDHWWIERTALIGQLDGIWAGVHDGSARAAQLTQAVLQLAATNAALWQAEDELRGYRTTAGVGIHTPTDNMTKAALCGVRIQALNDHRVELIEQINHAAAHPGGPEKL